VIGPFGLRALLTFKADHVCANLMPDPADPVWRAVRLRIPGSRTELLAVADGNRYADLTSGGVRASAGCGREQTMTATRTTGQDTTVKIQSLVFRRGCRTEIT